MLTSWSCQAPQQNRYGTVRAAAAATLLDEIEQRNMTPSLSQWHRRLSTTGSVVRFRCPRSVGPPDRM